MKMRGFTLIEAVLSLAVMAVGLLGVLYAFQSMSRSSVLADQTVIASNIARATIDQIIAKRDASGYAAALSAITSGTFNQNPATNHPGYVVTVTAYEVDPDKDGGTDDFLDASANSGYARVTVATAWNNNANSMNLVTLIADY